MIVKGVCMRCHKVVFKVLMLVALGSASSLMAADFDWMANLNMSSQSNPIGYRSKLSSRFGLSDSQLSLLIKGVSAPADAYMVLRLAEISGKSPEFVMKTYHGEKHQGWGKMAKDLGIKPGSKEFKALKNGHDLGGFDDKHPKKGHKKH